MTANSAINKEKRQAFAEKLLQHHRDGDLIIYYDESNFNMYCRRSQGRSKIGERATVTLPPSKGPNLQIQCAVSSSIGVVNHRRQRGSINMAKNAEFVNEGFARVLSSEVYRTQHDGKNVVIVFDNAPAHPQTEDRVVDDTALALLRLAPYSRYIIRLKVCVCW